MKKFVSKMLAGALSLSMLCGVAAAEGETYVSWYTFGDALEIRVCSAGVRKCEYSTE